MNDMTKKNDYLVHYGVLGMKWGIRNDRRAVMKAEKRARKEQRRKDIERGKTLLSYSERTSAKAMPVVTGVIGAGHGAMFISLGAGIAAQTIPAIGALGVSSVMGPIAIGGAAVGAAAYYAAGKKYIDDGIADLGGKSTTKRLNEIGDGLNPLTVNVNRR